MTPTTHELDTPALLIDLDVTERNIWEMAEVAAGAGVALRPHTKTHKSPSIARRQRDAGARGITVAKLGEAEVMIEAGLHDLLIAYPLVGEVKLARLAALMERADIRVTTDSLAVAEAYGRLGRSLGRPIQVLVEVDTGMHRLGRAPGEPTAELVRAVSDIDGVEVVGLLTHAGHAYGAATAAALRAAAVAEGEDLVSTAALLAKDGISIREISVGSTPTAREVAGVAGVTEIRPGTYVFNDVQQMRLGVASEADCAARVLTTVVALHDDGRFVVDAGSKCLSSDGTADAPTYPGRGWIAGRPDLLLDRCSEEHGVGHRIGDGSLAIGDRLEVIPLHVCAAINLFDEAVGVRSGEPAETIAIAARGRVR